jgi:hypothetical protein
MRQITLGVNTMNSKTLIRLVVLIAVAGVAYWIVTTFVQKDMDKNQQDMNRAVKQLDKDIPTEP